MARAAVALLVGCSDDPAPDPEGRVVASLGLTNITQPSPPMADADGWPSYGSDFDPCANPGWSCEDPTELSVRLQSAYLSIDVDTATGENIGETQSIYASPDCYLIPGGDGVYAQPDLGTCGLDLKLESSAGKEINAQPGFLDLAKTPAEVTAALEAGRFAIAAGTYKYASLAIGTNAVQAPPDGTQDSLPPGTAMNIRFKSPGMEAAYEVRIGGFGATVKFNQPLAIDIGQTLDVELEYDLARSITVIPEAQMTDTNLCAPPQNGMRYCIDPSRLNLHPVLKVDGVAVGYRLRAARFSAVGAPGRRSPPRRPATTDCSKPASSSSRPPAAPTTA